MEQLLVCYILMQSYNLLSYFLHEIRKTHLSLIFPSKITSLHILEEQKYKNTISAYLKSQKQNISIALSQIQMVQSRMFPQSIANTLEPQKSCFPPSTQPILAEILIASASTISTVTYVVVLLYLWMKCYFPFFHARHKTLLFPPPLKKPLNHRQNWTTTLTLVYSLHIG